MSEVVRAIVAANRYMTLATADLRGTPWASPVGEGDVDRCLGVFSTAAERLSVVLG